MSEITDRPRDFIIQAIPMRDHPEEYARKVRKRATPNRPRSAPACWSCRTRKVRCIQGAAGEPCLRCKHFEQTCVPQTRQRRPHQLKHMYREFVTRMEFSPPLSTAATPESYMDSGETPSDTSFQTPTETASVGTQTESDYSGERLANLVSNNLKSTTDGDAPGPTSTEPSAPFQITRPASFSDRHNLEHSIGAACRMLSRVEAMTQSLQGIMVRLVQDHRRLVDNSPRNDQISTKRTSSEDRGWNQDEIVTILDVWDEIGELNIA